MKKIIMMIVIALSMTRSLTSCQAMLPERYRKHLRRQQQLALEKKLNQVEVQRDNGTLRLIQVSMDYLGAVLTNYKRYRKL